jgi:hypothetical protein
MKDYIEEKYPEVHRSYNRLREAVVEAWESISEATVKALVRTMPLRCLAVIQAAGGYTEY